MSTKTAKKTEGVVCPYCHIQFDDEYDIAGVCSNAAEVSNCCFAPSRRVKFKPQVVDENFVPIENDPARLAAVQSLINDGAAWHPDIDQDGSLGRRANDLIARKLCKPPRSEYAKKMRHMFDVAARFGINQKDWA
jgi:hypothetical protein